jgi:hypothetical protein
MGLLPAHATISHRGQRQVKWPAQSRTPGWNYLNSLRDRTGRGQYDITGIRIG